MKILVIMQNAPSNFGGGSLRITRMAKLLHEKHGVNYCFVTLVPSKTGLNESVISENGKIHINYIKIENNKKLRKLRYFYQLLKMIRPFDLVHCVGLSELSLCGAYAAKLLRKPLISELTVDPPQNINLRDTLYTWAFYKADGAVALTPYIFSIFSGKGIPKEKIFLRPNPVFHNHNDVNDNDITLIGKIRSEPHKKKHLILGRFIARKGHIESINILENLSEKHFLILAGPVLEEDFIYFESLKNYITEKKLNNQVLLWPHLVHNPQKLYQEVDSLWCTSSREGLPNVVLEALYAGCSVFCSSRLRLKGYVFDEKMGGEISENPYLAAQLIEQKLQNQNRRYVANTAKDAFNPDKIINQTFTFFERTANDKKNIHKV